MARKGHSHKVLFFTRGLGFGHATRDMAIEEVMRRMDRSAEVIFVSYGSGARALKMWGRSPIIEMGFSPGSKVWMEVASDLVKNEKPAIIVSDEEIAAIEIAERYNIPSIYITNWFPNPIEQLCYAARVIFPDLPDSFPPPKALTNISFVGPICKLYPLSPLQKDLFKRSYGCLDDEKYVLVTCGSVLVQDLLLFQRSKDAFMGLTIPARLFLLTGFLHHRLEDLTMKSSNMAIMDYISELPRYIQAFDLVITRGGHTTLWELALHGVPSISVPYGPDVNPMNERYAINMQRRGTTILVRDEEADPERLRTWMDRILRDQKLWTKMSEAGIKYRGFVGNEIAARTILETAGIL